MSTDKIDKNLASTKAKILCAARRLFIEKGFSGASMGNIAKLAGVNHSLLFHHFGTKEKLWLAVKESIARDNQEGSKMLPSLEESLASFLRKLIKKSIDFYQNNPDIVRMINWQRLEYSANSNIGVTLSLESQEWLNVFKHYQQKGDIAPNLKPEFLMSFVLSVISTAALDQNSFINTKKKLDQYIEFCVEQFVRGFKALDN